MYEIKETDNILVKYAKNEFNIANIHDCNSNVVIDILKNNQNILNNKKVILYLDKLVNLEPLSAIYLNKEYFYFDTCCDCYRHIRRGSIKADKDFNIYRDDAFKIKVLHNILSNGKIIYNKNRELYYTRVYLTAGGVITGKYIDWDKCYITKKQIEENIYTLQSVVSLECKGVEISPDEVIYCTDHRNVKLSALKKFYDVVIEVDERLKDKHIDIRKLNKLAK